MNNKTMVIVLAVVFVRSTGDKEMTDTLWQLFQLGLFEKMVIRTLVDGLKICHRDSISVRELEKLLENMKNE